MQRYESKMQFSGKQKTEPIPERNQASLSNRIGNSAYLDIIQRSSIEPDQSDLMGRILAEKEDMPVDEEVRRELLQIGLPQEDGFIPEDQRELYLLYDELAKEIGLPRLTPQEKNAQSGRSADEREDFIIDKGVEAIKEELIELDPDSHLASAAPGELYFIIFKELDSYLRDALACKNIATKKFIRRHIVGLYSGWDKDFNPTTLSLPLVQGAYNYWVKHGKLTIRIDSTYSGFLYGRHIFGVLGDHLEHYGGNGSNPFEKRLQGEYKKLLKSRGF